MSKFTVEIGETLDGNLDKLKDSFQRVSRADVFRLGIALLNIASDAKKKGQVLAIVDKNDHRVIKEVVLP